MHRVPCANKCDYGNIIVVYSIGIFCDLCPYDVVDNLLSSYNVDTADS